MSGFLFQVTMSATAVTKLAKPPMRKLFYNEAKKQLAGATIFSFSVVGAWKFFVTDPKKEKFAEFYA